ncbi:MAG TPA: 2Fe-2S iron-sulfur cluster-binding protein, partial [Rhodothermales bacterium]|nr:2Fe-2S iron-sulfur cluster-binding protein [Rhodothermales bacterium]
MATITIDGQPLEFEGQTKVLQLILDSGEELPHFCYHPALSIPANCRQCLVRAGTPAMDPATRQPKLKDDGTPEIAFMPKLQTACSLDAADGMVIETRRTSPLVHEAQETNLEFLLINHPLDCPICDQAGQCPLQIQAYKYGPEGSRFEFRKVHKPKRVQLGPRVVLDAERCINCTRCTRFTSEISKSEQLTIIARGVNNYPLTPPGVVFDEPYSLNVVDICPVGALTAADSRFKARAWEMAETPSITVVNAKGSNCFYKVRDNIVVGVSPRANAAVNAYWLADEDREVARFNDDRASGSQVRDGGTLRAASWEEAYDRAAEVLRTAEGPILFMGSAHASVEDNYL